MDDWAWEQLAPCLKAHVELPIVPLFCVVNGAKGGRRREVGTSIYLPGIDNAEIIDAVHSRRAPLVPVHSSLRL